jgi:Zn-dependent peptidase ImmA (M78 family)
VPQETFEIKVKDIGNWDDRKINELSKYFKVSGEVILRKLLNSNKISSNYYNLKKEEWEKNYINKSKIRKTNKKTKSSEKKESPKSKQEYYIRKASQALSRNGNFYTNLILEAYDSKLITNSTLADF